MRHYIITGGAGFIGSNMADRLLAAGHQVTGIDNFSTGQRRFLEHANRNLNFALVEADLLNQEALKNAFAGGTEVIHFSANADVRFGPDHPARDLEQNTIATFNVLEAMRANGIRTISFSSTGSVYGEAPMIPTPESAPFPVQTSLYGASKVAGEGLIQGEHGVSLQEQRDAIERYAAREDFEIARWFEERQTAAKQGRPVFKDLLARLRRGDLSLLRLRRGRRRDRFPQTTAPTVLRPALCANMSETAYPWEISEQGGGRDLGQS